MSDSNHIKKKTNYKLKKQNSKKTDPKLNQLDLFVAKMVDVSPKGDQTSMEVPLYSLSKKPDTEQFIWEKDGQKLIITPNKYGRATIWDKDILLFLFGQIAAAINNGFKPSRTIRCTAHDILVATHRGTSGYDYERLIDALRRLRGTDIETNIKMEGVSKRQSISFIQSWRTIEKNPDGKMIAVEITISEWLYQMVSKLDILTYDKEYFLIKGGLERRLYEIFRKHCGNQKYWEVKEDTLFYKSGSKGNIRDFRRLLKKTDGEINGYFFKYDKNKKDRIIVTPKRKSVDDNTLIK